VSDNSKIEWCDATWSPTTGCDRISSGCDHCYALTLAKRLKAMGSAKYQRDGSPRTSGPGFGVTVHPATVNLPLRWRKPRRVFVNPMSDLFHAKIAEPWLADIFAVMATARQHTFQVLTKRHARMRSVMNQPAFLDQVRERAVGKGMDPARWEWPLPNIWLGVSAETQKWAAIRILALLDTPAAVRFISAEPLLGPIDLTWLRGVNAIYPDWCGGTGGGTGCPHPLLDWVICGGESGPGARPMDIAWVRKIVEDCQYAEVAVFVKQLGSVLGRELGAGPKGGDWDSFPAGLKARKFPRTLEGVTA
jgi:protein gp37